MSQSQHWIATAGQPLRGTLEIPGDKSVSHRSVMLAALADGVSTIDGFLEGEDTRATAAIFARLGVRIETPSPSRRIVHGVGVDGLEAADGPLDCGNAGTGMRLLAGLLAAQPFYSVLVGDESLSKRPMRRVTGPLAQMGAKIDTQDDGTPPLRIHGGQRLAGIDYTLPVASAQVKSAILLAGRNFGSGSSREHAVWALTEYGFRAVIAPAFADIFYNNSLKNGLLPVALPEAQVAMLWDLVEEQPDTRIAIDLAAQTVSLPDCQQAIFAIDPDRKTCLLHGLDDLGYLLSKEQEIAAYEERSTVTGLA